MRISGLTHSRHSIVQDNVLFLSLSPSAFHFFFFHFVLPHLPTFSDLSPSSSFIALRFVPPTFAAHLLCLPRSSPSPRPTSPFSRPSSSFVPSSSLRSLPRLFVSLPSFLCPSSFYLLPPFSPLSFPPVPFPPSSHCLSASPFVPFPPPHFIENVWYAGAFYTGTEPPPLAGLMAGMEQSGRLPVRTFVSARDGPRRDVAFNLQPRF